jgi:hypothetical protein
MMTFRLTTPPRKPPANRKAKSNALTDTDSARLSHGGELSTSSCHILLMVLAAIGILASGAGSVSLLVVLIEYQRCHFTLMDLCIYCWRTRGPTGR